MKNKVVTSVMVTILFLSVLFIPFGKNYASAASREGVVTASTLNVREKPSTSSKKMGTVKKGQVVTITKQQSSWSQIKYGSKTGWVSKKYISTTKIVTATTSTTTKYYATASSLNIRQSASTSAKVMASVKKGESVTYYSKSGNWAKVKTTSGITGWASMTYLSKTKPVITKTYYVTANSLNVRASGSTSAKVIVSIKKGESVTYYSQSNNWGKIKTKSGATGYVSMNYLSATKPIASSAPSSKGVKGKVIILDAGHGGHDPGSIGANNKEKDLTLATAKRVKAKLESIGAKVVMTRTGDTYLTLAERVKISERNNADVFISIHYNSGPSSASGIETYFWKTNKDESRLASLVQQEIIKSTGMKHRKTAEGNFHVIRENIDSAILVELGFISNPTEENIIETSDFQNKAATGIAKGLESYFY